MLTCLHKQHPCCPPPRPVSSLEPLTVCIAAASFGRIHRATRFSQSCGSNTLHQGPSRMRALPSDACHAVSARVRRCLRICGDKQQTAASSRNSQEQAHNGGASGGKLPPPPPAPTAFPVTAKLGRQGVTGHVDMRLTKQLSCSSIPASWVDRRRRRRQIRRPKVQPRVIGLCHTRGAPL
jgi:hypothetical protein